MKAKHWIAMGFTYVPPVLLFFSPYLGLHPAPGKWWGHIIGSLVLIVFMTALNYFNYRQQKNIEEVVAVIKARRVSGQ